MDDRIDALLEYWFHDPRNGAPDLAALHRFWFGKDDAVDATIRRLFESDFTLAAAGRLTGWTGSARGALALVILLDQFSRNMFRGTARAFAQDAQALAICRQAIGAKLDEQLAPIERLFLYLPMGHSEDLAMQDESVASFAALVERCAAADRGHFLDHLEFAEQHRRIIARFGRFPHRNAALGRASTPEEEAFLQEPGSSF